MQQLAPLFLINILLLNSMIIKITYPSKLGQSMHQDRSQHRFLKYYVEIFNTGVHKTECKVKDCFLGKSQAISQGTYQENQL